MNTPKHMYMTVNVTPINQAVSVNCWMTTQRFWLEEIKEYPNGYTVPTNDRIWHIHSNVELPDKGLDLIVTQGTKILDEQAVLNIKRRPVNR